MIEIRVDAGFARPKINGWCDAHGILTSPLSAWSPIPRLTAISAPLPADALAQHAVAGTTVRLLGGNSFTRLRTISGRWLHDTPTRIWETRQTQNQDISDHAIGYVMQRRVQVHLPTPVRGRLLHLRVHTSGPWLVKPAPDQPVFLLVVRGIGRARQGRRGLRKPAFLLVTAVPDTTGAWSLPRPVPELVAWAWQRWEVEVMHRELKSGFGLGQQQAWNPDAAALVISWVVWLYAALMLAGYLSWGWEQAARQAAWQRRRRWTVRDVAQAVQQELWQLPGETFLPVWAVIRGDPPEMTLTIWPMGPPATTASRL